MAKSNLFRSVLGSFLISMGLIFSERAIEPSSTPNKNAEIGGIMFIIGWAFFLFSQPESVRNHGYIVPIIAIMGQMYMGKILKEDDVTRKDSIKYTTAFWMVFMVVWANYAFRMIKNNPSGTMYIIGGIAMVMMSMMGYFFYRENDWNTLTGGMIPKIETSKSIFNPFVAMFPFGWATLAIGNYV